MRENEDNAGVSRIVIACESDARRWDDYILAAEQATPFHLFGWREVIEEVYGFRPFYLMALGRKDAVTGILPVIEVRAINGRKAACSLPFCNYGGLCAADNNTGRALLEHLEGLAGERNWKSVQLRCLFPPAEPLSSLSAGYVTQIVALPKDNETFFAGLDRKLRWTIRKAECEPFRIEIGPEKVGDFYRVYSENMRDLGTPSHPQSFFENILLKFGGRANLILLYLGREPVGGMLTFHFKDQLSDPWASSRKKYFSLFPNYLLYAEAFKYAISLDAAQFDLGRSLRDSGTFDFKMKWKPEVKELYYGDLLSGGTKATWLKHRNKLNLASRLYRRLPLTVSRFVGPFLRRYLP